MINRITFILVLISFSLTVSAKKVKFAVDMTGQVLSPNGIHVTGDFQTIAGFAGGDWQSNTTPCTQEGSTLIYSIIVELPAFNKYEYKFVNGDQFYEAEFVPVESRVGYNFVDNRWLYVDSLADDTTFVGNILFAGNAPAGLTLARFVVDMQNLTPDPAGAHVAGDFQGWDPATTRLYSFGSSIYEIIAYVTAGTYQFKFYNGNTAGASEIVPVTCAVNNNREIQATADIVMSPICFNACVLCSLTDIDDAPASTNISVYPNPAAQSGMITFGSSAMNRQVFLTDVSGRTVRVYEINGAASLEIERGNLDAGVYFIKSYAAGKPEATAKLIFE
jgi:hypothetical protein